MGYNQVLSHRGTVIPKRDIERETDRYSNKWVDVPSTPEQVHKYLLEKYGPAIAKVHETDKTQRTPRFVYSDGLTYARYMEHKSDGLSDQKIADMYGIARSTLVGRRKNWAINLQSR